MPVGTLGPGLMSGKPRSNVKFEKLARHTHGRTLSHTPAQAAKEADNLLLSV